MTASNHTSALASRLRKYGEWAVVTGASDGIGRAFAHELAASGLNLLLVARREARLKTLAEALRSEHGVQCRVLALDLSTSDALAALQSATADLDVGMLIASAGYGSSGPFLANEIASELNQLQVNCVAVLAQSWHFGRLFSERGRGGIILLSSILGFQGTPMSANYAATKTYVQALAEGMRHELKAQGVDVIASAPGPVATGFAARAKMRMALAATPETVARSTLRALGRRTTVRPGVLSKALGWPLSAMPRTLRVRVTGLIMRRMLER